MDSPTFEAPPMGTLGTLIDLKVLLGVFTLPLPLPSTATVVDEDGTVWSEACAPSAAAVAAALEMPARPGGTL